MSRNSLVVENLKKPAAPSGRGVWEMVMTVVGAAFGAPAARRREPGR